eukprot:scaffold63456_cov55-Phaeocystis_antarctica.AAC.3
MPPPPPPSGPPPTEAAILAYRELAASLPAHADLTGEALLRLLGTQQHGQSVQPGQCPGSAPAPPKGTPGTPRRRPCH